ncbi:acyltransferase [Rhizobium sp.]
MLERIAEFSEKFQSSLFDRHGLLGSSGYSVPDIGKLETCTFLDAQAKRVPNVVVEGEADGSNLIVWAPHSPPEKLVRILVTRHVKSALVILGDALTLRPTIRLFNEEQTVILSGGETEVGHAGDMLIDLWERGQTVFFGRGSTSNASRLSLAGAERMIVVGDDCMLADGISLSTHDMHAVIDMKTGQMMNVPGDVILEPHVWLARNVSIAKNVCVGLGSVVAAHSLVNKDVERFTIVGGIPAKTIRRDATWDRTGWVRPNTLNRIKELADAVPQFRWGR